MPNRPLPLTALLGCGLLLCSLRAAAIEPPSAAPVAEAPAQTAAPGAIRAVDSIAALQAAINVAVAGDTIALKNGVYPTSAPITVNRAGTADRPITIAAESVGGVEIAGSHGFAVMEPATDLVISGFKFTHAAGRNSIDEGTSRVRFTRNTFLCSGDGAYLTVAGDDAQIDYNEFGPKKATGTMIAVAGPGSQVARRLWIHHNYFHDFANDGSNGAEMIRFGLLSAHGQSTGAGLVEHNLFVRCRGVSDMISNRCSGNTFRYNTFLDSPTSHVTLRLGNDCVVSGNYFRNTEGLRFFGARHQILSNYFEGNYIAVAIGNGDTESTDGAQTNNHTRPDDCVIAFNTFIDNRTHYQMSRRSPSGLGATKTTFANNLLQDGGAAADIKGPNLGAIWRGNLLWGTATANDLPAEGYTTADPMLVAGPDGIKRLQAGSPAIAAALGDFPAVAFDLDGQPRPEKKAIGADELSPAPATARFLTPADVGPEAK